MKPSTNKEECTIDITATEIPFSCIVDGNESIKAWQIVIYDILDDKKVYDTGEIPLGTYFYPIDEKNRNVVFTKNIKDYGSIITEDSDTEKIDSFVNRAEAYYWTITFVGTSGSTTTSYQEVFYANANPSLSFLYKYPTSKEYKILDADTVLEGKSCTFKAEYTQAEGIQLKRYGWRITDNGNGQVLVDTITKNQIYGSADNIICKYDGFLNGNNYTIELYIETQNNTKITSSFNVPASYVTTFLSNDFSVEALKNEPAIMLDWSKALVIAGILKDEKGSVIAVKDTTFKANYPVDNQCSIKVPDDYSVEYNDEESLNFDIDENSYISYSTQLLSDEYTELFSAEGQELGDNGYYEVSRKLKYSNGVFTYDIVGQNGVSESVTCAATNRPSEYVWYNIFMPPLANVDEFKVYEGVVKNCIYPSENLYPSTTFYPTFGNWSNLKQTSNNTETGV